MNIHPNLCCQAALFVLLTLPGTAAVYVGTAYEGFNYSTVVDAGNVAADGNVASNNGGTGWNATGSAVLANTTEWLPVASGGLSAASGSSISAPGLTKPPVPTSGNRLTVASGQATRPLGQTVDEGSLYVSFLISRTNDTFRTVNMAFFGIATGASTATERFGFGQYGTATAGTVTDGNFGGVFLNSNPANLIQNSTAPIAVGTGTTHLIITRIDFNASGVNERVRVYINPGSFADESALIPYLDNSAFDLGSITALRPFAGAAATGLVAATAEFDEMRVGSTWSQVAVPEPTSLITAGLGLVGLLSRRRRG